MRTVVVAGLASGASTFTDTAKASRLCHRAEKSLNQTGAAHSP